VLCRADVQGRRKKILNKLTKKLFVIFTLLVGIMVKTQIVSAGTLSIEDSGYYFDRYKPDGSDRHSWNWNLYTIDGNVAYCIEPNVHEGVDYTEASYEATGLPTSIRDRLLLIGYYGYTYSGHQTIQYRAATQGMIWDTIVGDNAYTHFTTGRFSTGSILDVSKERAEIERLISNHYKVPSFSNQTYTLQVGESITLSDTNNVLGDFNISVDGANYSIDGNQLTLIATKSGDITLTMTKKIDYSSSYKIFTSDGYQNMMTAGNVDPVNSNVKISAYYGSIELNKTDEENKIAQGQATLEGAVYGVYKNDGTLVTEITTDVNGYAKSDAILSYGSYYLQEINPSTGYYLDNNKYSFEIKGTEIVTKNVTEKVIKNYVSILKQYDYVDGNTTFLNAESGITFEIYYPNGTKYSQITTDKNGYATINIPYGIWRFHQVNTNTGFEKIYDFYITIDENSESEQYFNILNNKLSAYLQVIKIDEETNNIIALADTTFKILNTDTNQYVSQYVGGKIYSEFKTDENGRFMSYLKLEAGNYKLIEVSSPKNYLLNNDDLTFSIGEDTHYDYTTYGAVVTIYFKDQVIKGQLEINKKGESVVIDNGTFSYEEIPLDSVTYEIYAKDDILSADGKTLYYEKDQLVDTITTDKDGYAISKELYLGTYYLVEVNTKENYILDSNKYEFTLTEKDNKTPIVYTSYSALNLLKKGTLDFSKTDVSTGKGISNTKIEIYHINDDNSSELIFTGLTDEDGKITITDLFVGKFTIVETEASTGYRLSDEVVTFEIMDNGEIVKANMTNEKITSTIKLHKVDENGNSIAGVEIGIFDLDGNLLETHVTDEFGDIEIELEYGSYYYQELQTIDGYVLNDEKVYFDVTIDGEIIQRTIVNETIKVPDTFLNDSKLIDVIGILFIIVGAGYIIFDKYKKN
jgi:hypothetical protein